MKNSSVMDETNDILDTENENNETKNEGIPQKQEHPDCNPTASDVSCPPGFKFLNDQSTFKPQGLEPHKTSKYFTAPTSSDDSCPPGFEFLKGQSTFKSQGSETYKTSKCSTTFSRYRKKDYKWISLLHEINRIIEVGGALGYEKRRKRVWIRELCFRHNISFLGVRESTMTRLELFHLRSMWGNYSLNYACSMARGLSGEIISMRVPAVFTKEYIWCNDNYVIVQGKWLNISHTYFMVNVYGPQYPAAKVTLWRSLLSFVQHHQGWYVLFGDLNEVRDESEHSGTNYSRSEAQVFNNFVADSGLHEITMGGKSFTWMNKLSTKMSKLDWFLLSEEVLEDNHDLKAIVLDRVWSDYSPILLHTLKIDYGPITLKIFHYWFNRKDIDVVVNQAFIDSSQNATGSTVYLHDKLKFIKYRLKTWNAESKKNEVNRKHEVLALVQDIEHKIDSSLAS
ncbi:RNA-directed DNA polymerase, eukaryota, Reverse transcriptase zinc-binding domain protein [Artemisia annua]|uniref:RNA-directed DNA polymerase, eukaryota, Reverse transcriptase zinc-binding domain protein n=1 Tax=Artemisia annua TaxID=35608 RepID=A0A2U1LB04_ARTAN|nr:RNA-directed DNA polymerase, eukaryota, Reverse transcriptase zinc-binding domain protein [Artemisia annua]